MQLSSVARQESAKASCDDQTRDMQTGINGCRKVTAVVIGGGPIGTFCAMQLNGLECIHNQDCCRVLCHEEIGHHQSIFVNPVPNTLEISDRGKTACGNWFDRFCYDTDNRAKSCLHWQMNPARGIDCLMISDSAPGGSWSHYHPEQSTISPFGWMGMPDWPIEHWIKRREQSQQPGTTPDGEYIYAGILCQYFDDYSRRSEFLAPSQVVQGGHVNEVAPQADGQWLLHCSQAGAVFSVQSKYVVVACGQTRPRQLGVPGENCFPWVVHSSCDARRALESKPPGQKVLMIGKGLSAADILEQIRIGEHQVTHLIPERKGVPKSESSSAVLDKLQSWPEEYPVQSRAGKLFTGRLKGDNSYTRRPGWTIERIAEQGWVWLAPEHVVGTGAAERQRFDLVCIVIGSDPDFSFLGLDVAQGKQLIDSIDGGTMETSRRNLFLAGMCAGEPFQRYSLGHALAVAETIRQRELSDH